MSMTKSKSKTSDLIDSVPEILVVVMFLGLIIMMLRAVGDENWPKAIFYTVGLLGLSVERKLVAILDTLKSIEFATKRRY